MNSKKFNFYDWKVLLGMALLLIAIFYARFFSTPEEVPVFPSYIDKIEKENEQFRKKMEDSISQQRTLIEAQKKSVERIELSVASQNRKYEQLNKKYETIRIYIDQLDADGAVSESAKQLSK